MRVSLFIPCLVDQFHPRTGENTVRVLEKIGIHVSYPEDQVCCGQAFFKAGYWKETIPLAKNTISAFEKAELVVAPSGSCVNMIRHHYVELFRDHPEWLERSRELAGKTYELSEFLVRKAGVEELGAAYRGKVTYHDSCQVLRGLGISSEPRRLLKRVKGLELVEMENSDRCCGFGGVFSFKYPHISNAMAGDKAGNILASGADAVVGCEISCLMHIGGTMKQKGLPVKALHLADVLAGEER
jgi:L-lactate dehydrogenase complex protein LldE